VRGGEESERGGKEKVIRGEKKEGIKIGFWNVAGVKGKDEDFWEKIREWDVIGMMETWKRRTGRNGERRYQRSTNGRYKEQ